MHLSDSCWTPSWSSRQSHAEWSHLTIKPRLIQNLKIALIKNHDWRKKNVNWKNICQQAHQPQESEFQTHCILITQRKALANGTLWSLSSKKTKSRNLTRLLLKTSNFLRSLKICSTKRKCDYRRRDSLSNKMSLPPALSCQTWVSLNNHSSKCRKNTISDLQ